MRVSKWLAGVALAAVSSATCAQTPADAAQSAANIHAHIAFLANDLLRGREAGTPDYDIAAAYVASQMEQLGLQPHGDGETYAKRR